MVSSEWTSPRPATARELKSVLEAERAGQPFLLYRDGEAEQRIVTLDDASRTVTLGRGEHTDVQLNWDDEVSAVHAEIHCTGGAWTVADDGLSRNGTFVNGARLSARARLHDGDQLRLGRTLLVFRSAAVASIAGTVAAEDVPTVDRLSDTQRRVLVSLCRPYRDGGRFVTPSTNQQIADEVFLSVEAVKTHLRLLFAKFELDGLPQNQKRVRLAECALQWGLVSPRDL
jgi:pSer/pThr/pTyr-binding forkhead associated (FHA) protein